MNIKWSFWNELRFQVQNLEEEVESVEDLLIAPDDRVLVRLVGGVQEKVVEQLVARVSDVGYDDSWTGDKWNIVTRHYGIRNKRKYESITQLFLW